MGEEGNRGEDERVDLMSDEVDKDEVDGAAGIRDEEVKGPSMGEVEAMDVVAEIAELTLLYGCAVDPLFPVAGADIEGETAVGVS